MPKTKKPPRGKRYEGGTVRGRSDGKKVIGSLIVTEIGTFEMPHYPSRIKNVTPERDEMVVVETRDGEKTFFGRADALEEGGSWFQEITTGSSMGGHSPKAHGKIRYIVRAFGKWAGGKQHICVGRLLAEHPEVVGGSKERANALCAWMKDQWTASTHWRGRGSNPKVAARNAALEAKGNATAYARFTAGMPMLTNTGLDALVEVFNDLRPIEDMLSELGIDPGEDPYVALFEHDAVQIEAASLNAVAQLRAGEDVEEAMKVWLAVHGDIKPIAEADLEPAVDRVLKGDGSIEPRNDLDRRVLEAQGLGEVPEPWDMGPAPMMLEEEPEEPAEPLKVSIELPPASATRLPTVVVEGETLPSGELAAPRADLMRLDFDLLVDRARELYEATTVPTPAGRSYLGSCGRSELGRLVERLEEAFASAKKRAKEDEEAALEESGSHFGADPQFQMTSPTPGWDTPARDKVGGPTELDHVAIKIPPNLRRGYLVGDNRRRACVSCLNFVEGQCRAYDNYAVSAGDLCDSYEHEAGINEADGYMTRGGEKVGRYVKRGSGVALHLTPGKDGTYDEKTVRMGMSRLSNPDNPCDEVHVGHVRIRHDGEEHAIEPDWGSYGADGENPEVAHYSTTRHGARRATEMANSRVRRDQSVGDAITKVDAGTPDTPDNPQWPMMPQIGEARETRDLADQITDQITETWQGWGKWKASKSSSVASKSSSGSFKGHVPALLKHGTHGHYMRRVKNQMFKRMDGHFPHAEAGPRFNKHFHQMVRKFQKAHGLKVDGVIGRQTLAAIKGNKRAAHITPGRLTAADRHWIREGDIEPTGLRSSDEIADLVVEQLSVDAATAA